MLRYTKVISATAKKSVCARILRALPEWFGIEKATRTYIAASAELPMLACFDGSIPAGFVSLKMHGSFSAEIYVMGVAPGYHRRGIGGLLLEKAESYLAGKGIRFLQVKTLSPARENAEYAGTRRFYHSCGFVPLEEFKDLWGKDNPCLLLVKTIP